MNTEIQALEARLEAMEARCMESERQYRKAARRWKLQAGLAFGVLVAAILLFPGNRAAIAQGYGTTLQQLLSRLTAVESKTQFVAIGSDGEMHIVGTNLHIENGLGATNGEPFNPSDIANPVVNGKGNLIIGYNLLRIHNNARTGSHNLILGDNNNYTSFGGLVGGSLNTISGPYASVVSGILNTAGGDYSCVSCGLNNGAGGMFACVTGGVDNQATGTNSCVSGGQVNTAGGESASISGGSSNIANGAGAAISGGALNEQDTTFGWTGGFFHSP